MLGALYSLYLLYLGLPRLMKCPEDKAIGYSAVVVVCAIVLSVVIAAVGAMFTGVGMMATCRMSRALQRERAASEVQFDKSSPMGKLQEFGKKMEDAGKKMDSAQKSGDQEAQMKDAMEGFGLLLGGGTRVDPVQIDQLKSAVSSLDLNKLVAMKDLGVQK